MDLVLSCGQDCPRKSAIGSLTGHHSGIHDIAEKSWVFLDRRFQILYPTNKHCGGGGDTRPICFKRPRVNKCRRTMLGPRTSRMGDISVVDWANYDCWEPMATFQINKQRLSGIMPVCHLKPNGRVFDPRRYEKRGSSQVKKQNCRDCTIADEEDMEGHGWPTSSLITS
jgi:hypothetical protein